MNAIRWALRKKRALSIIAETIETGATMLSQNVQPEIIADFLTVQDERIKRLIGDTPYTAVGVQ